MQGALSPIEIHPDTTAPLVGGVMMAQAVGDEVKSTNTIIRDHPNAFFVLTSSFPIPYDSVLSFWLCYYQ